ncbi:MAG: hypothetical protein ACOX00_09740 [Peptoniphilaceae bacterium]
MLDRTEFYRIAALILTTCLKEDLPVPAVVLQPEPALPDTPFRSAYGYFRLKQDGARDTELEEYILRVFGSGNAKQK